MYENNRFYCDICGDFEDASDFNDGVKEIKRLGWQIKRVDDTYEHYCPDCKEEV